MVSGSLCLTSFIKSNWYQFCSNWAAGLSHWRYSAVIAALFHEILWLHYSNSVNSVVLPTYSYGSSLGTLRLRRVNERWRSRIPRRCSLSFFGRDLSRKVKRLNCSPVSTLNLRQRSVRWTKIDGSFKSFTATDVRWGTSGTSRDMPIFVQFHKEFGQLMTH